ncbi:hypothetical protein GCM10022238_22870 [Gordonia hankookensis]
MVEDLLIVDVPARLADKCPDAVGGGVDADLAFDAIELGVHGVLLGTRWFVCNPIVAQNLYVCNPSVAIRSAA